MATTTTVAGSASEATTVVAAVAAAAAPPGRAPAAAAAAAIGDLAEAGEGATIMRRATTGAGPEGGLEAMVEGESTMRTLPAEEEQGPTAREEEEGGRMACRVAMRGAADTTMLPRRPVRARLRLCACVLVIAHSPL